MQELFDVTIIGGGPVGLFGAFYAGLRQMSVKIIDSLPELGGQLTALYPEKFVYDMPGFPEVFAKDLARKLIRQAMRFEPTLALEQRAEMLERRGNHWQITTTSGETHLTKTLIICAGAGAFSPKRHAAPGVAEFEGRGVSYGVRRKADFEDRRVLVVGGGDSAVDWALNLEPIARHVILAHRRDVFRAHEESVRQLHQGPVEVLTFWEVSQVHGRERVEACVLVNNRSKEQQTVEVDAVVFNLGFTANLGPIKEWGLELEGNQIKVNSHMETNLPGIFAAGDVNTYDGKLKLIATGSGEVTIAVCFAKHLIDPSAKVFPGHSSDMDLSPAPPAETS